MRMKRGTEWRTTHTRMIMRDKVKLICHAILMLLIVMMNGEWWKNLVI